MQNKSLMFQVCMVLVMLLVAPVKGLAQGVTISGHPLSEAYHRNHQKHEQYHAYLEHK